MPATWVTEEAWRDTPGNRRLRRRFAAEGATCPPFPARGRGRAEAASPG
ncbi:hypothetical protein N136_03778 [Leifsonia aquatica ATCC 14665]|uniref:Uncharacterized protein n=1 Tax=Leifsonia aquatica ATCC 14665 TaxID=1358026 RepID=U2R3P6_LEIAQ|nr:hypothetical protein N136_03778 [Leifsonia aquatica ATCC 14665]